MVLLHRFLMGLANTTEGFVDHEDRNKDNHQMENLRMATKQENAWNTGKKENNKSGSIGVFNLKRKKNGKSFVAYIRDNGGKRAYLGVHATQREAEIAYDMACWNLRGDKAVLNDSSNVFKNMLCIE